MKKWEYLETGFKPEKQLNELGNEGWELVTVFISTALGRRCIFKREKL
jgi:hypothetical protein